MSQYRAKTAMRPRGRSVVAGLEASLRLARTNHLEGGDPPRATCRRSRSVAAQLEANLQTERQRPTTQIPPQTRGPEPVDEEKRRAEMKALGARMAKANEALWASRPWKKAKTPSTSEAGDQGSPQPSSTPASSLNITRSRAPSSAAPSRFKPVRNWVEWPAEHRLEYMRVLSGRDTQPAEPPKGFRPPCLTDPGPSPGDPTASNSG